MTPLGRAAFSVERADGTRAVAFAVANGGRTWVFLDGQTFVVETGPSRRAGPEHDASALTAPMPATVTQIHVTPGQGVLTGETLITLEAMKMELPIRATFTGTVAAINCRVGEMVQPGNALVELRTPNPNPNPNQNPEPRTEPEHEPGTRNPEA